MYRTILCAVCAPMPNQIPLPEGHGHVGIVSIGALLYLRPRRWFLKFSRDKRQPFPAKVQVGSTGEGRGNTRAERPPWSTEDFQGLVNPVLGEQVVAAPRESRGAD